MALNNFSLKGINNDTLHILRGMPVLEIPFSVSSEGVTLKSKTAIITSHPNSKLSLTPIGIKGVHDAKGNFVGNGISISLDDKLVISAAPISAIVPPINNFVLEIILTEDTTAVKPNTKKIYLEIHFHEAMEKAWFSPSELTVYPNNLSDNQETYNDNALHLHIQFNDKTIITSRNVGVDFAEAAISTITSSSTELTVFESSLSILIKPNVSLNTPITITAQLNPKIFGNDITVIGKIIAKALPKVVSCLNLTKESVTSEKIHGNTNFLFISEGFKQEEEPYFNAIVDNFLHRLKTDSHNHPYHILSESMNFWKAFIPGRESGINVDYEVIDLDEGETVMPLTSSYIGPEFEMPTTFSPQITNDLFSHNWGRNQVFLYFGLPVLSLKDKSTSEIKVFWKSYSSLPASLIDEIDGDLIDDWKKYATRRLLEKHDTAFQTSIGGRTKIMYDFRIQNNDKYKLAFSRERALNNWLTTLQYDKNVIMNVGSVFDINTVADTNLRLGKDFENVVIIINSDFGRSANYLGYLFSGTHESKTKYHSGFTFDIEPVIGKGSRAIIKLSNIEDGVDLEDGLKSSSAYHTLIHEMSHSLGLSDEYSEPNISRKSFLFQKPLDTDSETSNANIQYVAELNGKNANNPIDPVKIKWRWHRIKKSAIIQQINEVGNLLELVFTNTSLKKFEKDEILFLRFRDSQNPLKRTITFSENAINANLSPELQITEVINPLTVRVKFVTQSDSVHTLAILNKFRFGCVAYVPINLVQQDIGNDTTKEFGKYAEFVTRKVLKRLISDKFPLTGKDFPPPQGTGDTRKFNYENDQIASVEVIKEVLFFFKCRKQSSKPIGLYVGGEAKHYGVYHPTGHCMMRNSHSSSAAFCPVCRYILTDMIDPTKHPEVDDLFVKEYVFDDAGSRIDG
jgi:hypothetical protein